VAHVRPATLPEDSLLRVYTRAGDYTDCYLTEVGRSVTLAEYVETFYRTPLFRLERWILDWLAKKPSTDTDARELAHGRRETFAAWHVESRATDQLLLCDFRGGTRSWLMVVARREGTRLHFGSAVMRAKRSASGEKRLSVAFWLLLGFHKAYSRALLASARRALERGAS
jgi:hypothetical protein